MDRAAVRAKVWTVDLLRALDGQLDLALPYSLPGSSPPPQPSTPPLQGKAIFIINASLTLNPKHQSLNVSI